LNGSKAGAVRVGDSKVRVAKGLQFRGRVAEAEAIYREVLRDEPGDSEALEGLGVLVFQQGRSDSEASRPGNIQAIRFRLRMLSEKTSIMAASPSPWPPTPRSFGRALRVVPAVRSRSLTIPTSNRST
jgi:hypothetical protein